MLQSIKVRDSSVSDSFTDSSTMAISSLATHKSESENIALMNSTMISNSNKDQKSLDKIFSNVLSEKLKNASFRGKIIGSSTKKKLTFSEASTVDVVNVRLSNNKKSTNGNIGKSVEKLSYFSDALVKKEEQKTHTVENILQNGSDVFTEMQNAGVRKELNHHDELQENKMKKSNISLDLEHESLVGFLNSDSLLPINDVNQQEIIQEPRVDDATEILREKTLLIMNDSNTLLTDSDSDSPLIDDSHSWAQEALGKEISRDTEKGTLDFLEQHPSSELENFKVNSSAIADVLEIGSDNLHLDVLDQRVLESGFLKALNAESSLDPIVLVKTALHDLGNLKIANQIKFVLKNGGEGEIRLLLRPESLGVVHMNLKVIDNDFVSGKIFVENTLVQSVFEQNMSDLRDAMKEQGFTLGNVEVALEQDRTHHQEKNENYKKDLEILDFTSKVGIVSSDSKSYGLLGYDLSVGNTRIDLRV